MNKMWIVCVYVCRFSVASRVQKPHIGGHRKKFILIEYHMPVSTFVLLSHFMDEKTELSQSHITSKWQGPGQFHSEACLFSTPPYPLFTYLIFLGDLKSAAVSHLRLNSQSPAFVGNLSNHLFQHSPTLLYLDLECSHPYPKMQSQEELDLCFDDLENMNKETILSEVKGLRSFTSREGGPLWRRKLLSVPHAQELETYYCLYSPA